MLSLMWVIHVEVFFKQVEDKYLKLRGVLQAFSIDSQQSSPGNDGWLLRVNGYPERTKKEKTGGVEFSNEAHN